MKSIKSLVLLIVLLNINTSVFSQIIQQTGYIYSEIAARISNIPSANGNEYSEPNLSQLNTWESTLNNLLLGNYSEASDSANSIGYNLINFTDTFDTLNITYYILQTADSNYWGTYVYNPNYCRALVIQAPHAKRDANTGHEGIHVFRETQAMLYQVNGTHRCNSSLYTNCTGSTTSCSGNSTSEPYRISDMAHVTQSIFQKTTEVLLNSFNNTYFIQLHGFTKLSTDPYLVLSNGTKQTPAIDYMPDFKNNLYNEDSVLTFKIAHIDTNWTRLRGFWNTQGRLINGSSNHCSASAINTNGRFFHIEQEKTRLRDNVTGWNKVANALKTTFNCTPLSFKETIIEQDLKIYPNPTRHSITIKMNKNTSFDKDNLIYTLQGQNISNQVSLLHNEYGNATVNLSKLPKGIYLVVINNSTIKIQKK